MTTTKKIAPVKSKLKVITPTFSRPTEAIGAALPAARIHSASYHYPLLADDTSQQHALLEWFRSVEDSRTMPWRKAWLDQSHVSEALEDKAETLNKRAYEVWVSEVSK